MYISQLIKDLQKIEKEHPNAICVSSNYFGGPHPYDLIKQPSILNTEEVKAYEISEKLKSIIKHNREITIVEIDI
jgi:hypothetical protein